MAVLMIDIVLNGIGTTTDMTATTVIGTTVQFGSVTATRSPLLREQVVAR